MSADAPRTSRSSVNDAIVRVITALALLFLVVLLATPFLALLLRASPARIVARLGDPAVQEALRLSLVTSAAATAIVILIGAPVAYLFATRDWPGKHVLEVLVDLPMVLPPTVAGFALLMAFGRMGLVGHSLSAFGLTLPFTTAGVVVAQVFMSLPFFVGPMRAGIASVDRRFIEAAATLRASERVTFFRVILPLALPSIIAGAAMSCARSLGEFGATITFAGNLPGTTQTMPLAVYLSLQSDLEAAVVLSVLLLLMSFLLLLGLRSAPAGWFWSRARVPAR